MPVSMTAPSFKLALVQMLVEGGRKEANLQRARDRVDEAAGRGASVVVLPEAMTLGWTDGSGRAGADEIPGGAGCVTLREAARRNGVYVCAGLVERDGGSIFNAAVLSNASGARSWWGRAAPGS
jgi:predicted amidohydrolase